MHSCAQVHSGVVCVCIHVGICTCPSNFVGSRHVQVCSVPLLSQHPPPPSVRCHLRLTVSRASCLGGGGASALPFLLAEPCPVQAAAEDRCQGGSVSIWPERLDGEIAPLAPQGPAGPCWMGLGDAWAMSFADEMNDHHQNTLSYVLINPPPDTRLEPNDIV